MNDTCNDSESIAMLCVADVRRLEDRPIYLTGNVSDNAISHHSSDRATTSPQQRVKSLKFYFSNFVQF
eukprot:3046449-Amphidinium_carterae.1